MPDFDEKNRLDCLYPESYWVPREKMMAPNEDGKSLKPRPILAATGSFLSESARGAGAIIPSKNEQKSNGFFTRRR